MGRDEPAGSRERAALERALRLARHRDPRRVAGARTPASSVALREVAEELEARGLRAWIPSEGGPASVLLVRGRPPARAGVAVVGTRASDGYGLACARRVAGDAVALGRPVVSGGAEGCDAAAHEGALAAGGTTVVVLGSGHDRPYPASHRRLFERIVAAGGAVVTPFWPDTPPARYRFLLRNEVVASISAAVVVARAGARSGALSTARAGRRAGRPVLAVPGDVGEGLAVGANRLLAEGGRPCLGPASLGAALGERRKGEWPVRHLGRPDPWPADPWPEETAEPEPSRDGATGGPTDPQQRRVLRELATRGARDLDGLVGATGLAPGEVASALLELELAGWIRRVEGGGYAPVGGAPAGDEEGDGTSAS